MKNDDDEMIDARLDIHTDSNDGHHSNRQMNYHHHARIWLKEKIVSQYFENSQFI
jgi:hypothetical protein